MPIAWQKRGTFGNGAYVQIMHFISLTRMVRLDGPEDFPCAHFCEPMLFPRSFMVLVYHNFAVGGWRFVLMCLCPVDKSVKTGQTCFDTFITPPRRSARCTCRGPSFVLRTSEDKWIVRDSSYHLPVAKPLAADTNDTSVLRQLAEHAFNRTLGNMIFYGNL